MIESRNDIQEFHSHAKTGEWIVYAVPVDDFHVLETEISILFIHTISTKKTFYFSFNHPDSPNKISIEDLQLEKFDNIKWTLNKKEFSHLISLSNVYDANLCLFFDKNEFLTEYDFETDFHSNLRRKYSSKKSFNHIIPLMKHLECFESMCESIIKIIYPPDDDFVRFNEVIVDSLSKLEKNGIYVDTGLCWEHFSVSPVKPNYVYSKYNLYTSTGRPTNGYYNINYTALNSKDGSRDMFKSRFGNDGCILAIDYSAFHPHIISDLTGYDLGDKDVYEYLAKLYFNKSDVDEFDISESKKITFRQLYGGIEDKYSHIKYFSNLKNYISTQWEYFLEHDYVFSPYFHRKITAHHIKDPSPTKLFNYILQATEGEIAIAALGDVNKYLENLRTVPILYIYDAIIFDVYMPEITNIIHDLLGIIGRNGKYPLKTYVGKTYGDMKLIC